MVGGWHDPTAARAVGVHDPMAARVVGVGTRGTTRDRGARAKSREATVQPHRRIGETAYDVTRRR